jgi:hypothetical protein
LVDGDDWLFGEVERAAGGYDAFRPELCLLMINHYLVTVGNTRRLPAHARRAFFQRVVEQYRHRLPAGGYPIPAGIGRLKHRLIGLGAYRSYATLRCVHRLLGAMHGLGGGHRGTAASAPRPTASAAEVPIQHFPAPSSTPMRSSRSCGSGCGPERRVAMGLVAATDVGEKRV